MQSRMMFLLGRRGHQTSPGDRHVLSQNGKLGYRTALPRDRQAPCAQVSLHTCPAPTVTIQRHMLEVRSDTHAPAQREAASGPPSDARLASARWWRSSAACSRVPGRCLSVGAGPAAPERNRRRRLQHMLQHISERAWHSSSRRLHRRRRSPSRPPSLPCHCRVTVSQRALCCPTLLVLVERLPSSRATHPPCLAPRPR